MRAGVIVGATILAIAAIAGVAYAVSGSSSQQKVTNKKVFLVDHTWIVVTQDQFQAMLIYEPDLISNYEDTTLAVGASGGW